MTVRTPIGRANLGTPSADRWAQQIETALRALEKRTGTGGGTTTLVQSSTSVISRGPDGDAEQPTQPQNFTVTGAYSTITLRWDFPTYLGHAVAEIYRSPTNNYGTAEKVHETAIAIWGDAPGPGATLYYWIRFRNINGDHGPINATEGTKGETAPDLDALFSLLNGKITSTYLDSLLANTIGGIPGIKELLDAQQETLGKMIGAFDSNGNGEFDLDERLAALQDKVDTNRQETDAGIVTVTDGLLVAVGDKEDLFQFVGRVDGIENILLNDETGLVATRSVLLNEYYTKTTIDSSLASIGQTVQAQIDNPDTGVPAAIAAATSLRQAIIDDEGGIISSHIEEYEITVDDVTGSLNEWATLTYDTTDNFNAQWGVTSVIGNLKNGLGLYNDGIETLFAIQAGKIAVVSPLTDEVTNLFTVVQDDPVLPDGVYMNTTFIKVANIRELVAGAINADTVSAGIEISAPNINGGVFTGGQYIAQAGSYKLDMNPASTLPFWFGPASSSKTIDNSNFCFTRTGGVSARGLEIRNAFNEIILDASGGWDGAYIKNLSVSSAAIQGQAITSPHEVEIESQNIGQETQYVKDYPTGTYIGGGIQFAISLSAIRTISSSRNDEFINVHVSVHSGDTKIKGYDYKVPIPIQNLPNTGSACGMFGPALLNAYVNSELSLKITITSNGLNTNESIDASLTGYILYAKK